MRVMSHRWEWVKSHKYLSGFGALLLVSAVLFGVSTFYFEGSFAYDHSPRFSDCPTEEDTGDIVGSCPEQWGDIDKFARGEITGYKDGEVVSSHFWVEISDVKAGEEEKAPQFWWLYYNDYLTEDGREEVNEGDFPDDVDVTYGDLKWNGDLREKLEAGTICRATIQPESRGYLDITTTEAESLNTDVNDANWNNQDDDGDGQVDEGFQMYNDEPDSDEIYVSNIVPNPKEVTADKIEIRENSMRCRFDFTEIMNKGMELDGKFIEWDGREPVIGGDDGDEGMTSFNVDFGLDSDLDGFRDENDECPETPGIEEKNGCPNQVSKVISVDGPRNVTVGEEVNYSVSVRNPDDDSTSISWSNGATGDSAVYKFNSTGNYTLSVTADDGFEEDTEEIRVRVEEKTLLGKVAEFFGGIWQFLTFQG